MNNTTIITLQKELAMRESAAAHLSGIPRQQNANAIHRLYDALCAAHIAAFEAA